ncbi:hypothetical protein HZS_8017, partial [Henneguya salminicola]
MEEKIFPLQKILNPILLNDTMTSSNLNLKQSIAQKNAKIDEKNNLEPVLSGIYNTSSHSLDLKINMEGFTPGCIFYIMTMNQDSVAVKTAYSFVMNEYPAPRYTSPNASSFGAHSISSNFSIFMDSCIKNGSLTSFKDPNIPPTSNSN